MSKTTKIVLGVVIAIIVIALVVFLVMGNQKGGNGETNLPEVSSAEQLTDLVNKIYDGATVDYNVETAPIDMTDENMVKSFTGLQNGQDLEYAVVSEPMINAQPYSLVIAKVKEGVNANEVAKAMSEGVDMRKWICVSAKKLYATNSGDVVFLIMTNETMAKSVYDSFKALAGTVGQEYEKTAEEDILPEDMSFPVPQ